VTPRSASSSSTSRYDKPYRKYQRTASEITSGGNRKPANAEVEPGEVTRPVSLLPRSHNATVPPPQPEIWMTPLGVPATTSTTRSPKPDRGDTPGSATAQDPVSTTRLQRLYAEQGQSPWLDNLTRRYLRDGTLSRIVAAGIRGVTANPTILARAIESSSDYDEQFSWLMSAGCSVEEAYWELVATDVIAACEILSPVYEASDGTDGFVSVEVAPELANDTAATIASARQLHQRIDKPNLLVKIPATAAGVPAVEAMIAEGRNINVTLIFSLSRYAQVIEAYLSGLEAFASNGGNLSKVHSVASFFVSRVDTEVDARLNESDKDRAVKLHGKAAVAQARLAYQLFHEQLASERWQHLANRGANPQLPLWASMSAKNPADRDTRYVEELMGPGTVSTLPESTITAFEDHGTLSRSIDAGVPEAREAMHRLADAGIDMDDVGLTLENQGVAAFERSFQRVTDILQAKRSHGG
jgi:transaldolase